MTKLLNWILLTVVGLALFAWGGIPALVSYSIGYLIAGVFIFRALS